MEVDRFLHDLRFQPETAPRPPVPGEENELVSNGGTSTRSTSSHKTQSSGKSEKSTKSRSPAATPRRSNLDKTGGSLSCSDTKLNGEEDAPLGFEPEGSEECANSPPFTENTTPPYKKWAENLGYLLEDGEGVKLYKSFLDIELRTVNPLDFWFACRGLKLVEPTDTTKIQSLSKLIYKKYIKGDQLQLDPKVKRGIAEKLKYEKYDQSVFDEAQTHVENVMRKDTYPLFLNSDIYLQYVQNGGESPKSSHSTSGSNSVRPVSAGPLPTVHEEKELDHADIVRTTKASNMPLNPSTLAVTQPIRTYVKNHMRRPEGLVQGNSWKTPVPSSFPYHVSYAPVSERDSENTSDAHTTDDAMSHTDSSIDGRDGPYGTKRWKKSQHKTRRYHIETNKNTGLKEQFIPRTERATPQNRNIAEKDPPAFASLLIDKLTRVLEDRKKDKKIQELSLDGTDSESEKPSRTTNNNNDAKMLFLSLIDNNDGDENAQSILEEHCNRIGWDISRGETPTGRYSPEQNLLHHRGQALPPGPNVTAVLHNSLNLSQSTPRHKKPRGGANSDHKDLTSHSLVSFDSGVIDDRLLDTSLPPTAPSRGHHKHHASHSFTSGVTSKDVAQGKYSGGVASKDSQAKTLMDNTPLRGSSQMPAYYGQHGSALHSQSFSNTILYDDRVRGSKDSSRSKRSECQDSGYNELPAARPPNLHDPATNKVLAWMLENEKISGSTNNQYSTDGSDKGSSLKHDRSSHRSGGSRKSGSTSRAQAQEHSAHVPPKYAGPAYMYSGRSVGVLPAQPISQDPSMPLLTPPHTMVQLEEAKRRLQEEAPMVKSRSFSGSSRSDNDKHLMPPPPIPPRGLPAKHIPPPPQPLDMSQSADEKPRLPPPAPDSIVVGYYFCSDPIPYRTTVTTSCFTLAHFKALLAKKGNFKYFFKKTSDEFETGIVYAEVTDDNEVLPLIDGKIIGKIEKVE